MSSTVFPSLSLHSSPFPFRPTPFTSHLPEFPHRFFQPNMDISEQIGVDSDDSATDNDEDYKPIVKRRKLRQFTLKDAPQAVVDWYMIALDKKTALKKSVVKEDALGHLLKLGWEIYYTQKKNKQELRYKAPNGRVYISLRTACKAVIDEGGTAVADHSLPEKNYSPPEKNYSLPEKNYSLPGKETAAFTFKEPEDDSERVNLPVPCVQNLSNKKTQPRTAAKGTSWRKSRGLLSYMMDQRLVSPGDRLYYNVASKEYTCWGSITNEGVIKCDCCSELFSVSNFEAHAGSTKRRPAANIFLEDGRSLFDCQNQMNQSDETKTTEKKVNNNNNAPSDTPYLDKNDCICSICHFGGELILCDLCPAAFHGSCLGFKGIPSGDWYCPSCCCKICGQVSYDFDDQVSFSDKSFVKCVQCEQNVHIGCVKCIQVLENGSNQIIDRDNWFCTRRCQDIHMGLQKLLWKQIPVGKKEDNLTWRLMKYCPNNMTKNHMKKLNLALGVIHKSFRPVKDPITKSDVIEDVVLSRRSELKRLNFEGFYTVVLERKNKITTVATVRVYGDEVAEIPLVATQLKYRRRGMCRTLMNELEQQLIEMGVNRMTLPAVPEALSTWTDGFGFSKMTDTDKRELVKYTFLGFQHTVRCQKDLLENIRISNNMKWRAWENQNQTSLEHDFSDTMCLDDWNSISEAF